MKFLDCEVDAEALLREIEFFLENSDLTCGQLSNGAVIKTDVAYVEGFFNDLLCEFSKAKEDHE
jgi:hypothetical protein